MQLQALASQQLDLEVHSRGKIVRLAVEGDTLQRLAPLSDTPAGFLAEWQSLDGKDAARWSSPGLEKLHARLQQGLRDCLPGFSARERRAGPGEPRWRLSLRLEDGSKRCTLPAALVFEVSLKDGAFFLERAGEQAAPGGEWKAEE